MHRALLLRYLLAGATAGVGAYTLLVWDQPAGAVGILVGASLLLALLARSARVDSLARDPGFPMYVIAAGGLIGGIYGISRLTGDGVAGGLLMMAGSAVMYFTGKRMSKRFRS